MSHDEQGTGLKRRRSVVMTRGVRSFYKERRERSSAADTTATMFGDVEERQRALQLLQSADTAPRSPRPATPTTTPLAATTPLARRATPAAARPRVTGNEHAAGGDRNADGDHDAGGDHDADGDHDAGGEYDAGGDRNPGDCDAGGTRARTPSDESNSGAGCGSYADRTGPLPRMGGALPENGSEIIPAPDGGAGHPSNVEDDEEDSDDHDDNLQSVSGSPEPLRRPSQALSATCLLYTSPSPRDLSTSRMPSSA